MRLNLTYLQKWVVGFLGAWLVLAIIGAFARADVEWGHVMMYLAGSCLCMSVMVCTKPLGIVARLVIGFAVLVVSLALTVLVTVTVQNAIAHIDPLEVWATCLFHTQVLVKTPIEIWRGCVEWWRTGSADAFRTAGCQGHHLFLATFFVIVFGVVSLRAFSHWSRPVTE